MARLGQDVNTPSPDLIRLQRQSPDPAKRPKVTFRLPGKRVGEDLEDFFTWCQEKDDRYGMPVSES